MEVEKIVLAVLDKIFGHGQCIGGILMIMDEIVLVVAKESLIELVELVAE